ncbi:unnamed protein product, partial [Closterium sp. Naga37s-1]
LPLIPLSFSHSVRHPSHSPLIPLSNSHSVRLHSHSPLILSFRAPSLSFPSHSLIPCAFTLIPLSFSNSVRLHSHSPLILSFRAPSLSFPSHSLIPCAFPLIPLSFSHSVRLHSPSPLILSFRVPSLSFPSVSHSVRHPSQSLFPCAFTLIPLSFSHSVRHPSHSPLILSFRASSLSFPSHSLIPCAFTLLPLSFSLRVCLPSHSPLTLSFRAPSLSFPSHSLIPCAFTRIPLYSSHVRVLSSPSGSLLTCAISLFPLMRVCPIPLCSAPPVRMLSLSPLRLSAHAQFCTFSLPYARPRYAPLPPTPFILCLYSLVPRSSCDCLRWFSPSPSSHMLMSFLCPRCRLCAFDTRSGLGRHMQSNSCPANLISSSEQLQAPKRARSSFIPPNPIPRAVLRLEPVHANVGTGVAEDVCIDVPPISRADPTDTSDTSSSSDSVDSALPFEQDDDASSNAAVSGADDDGGEGAQAGVALAEEEDAPQFNLKDALAHWILSNRLSISQINALLEILRKTILEIQDWKSYRDVQAYAESRATDGHRGWRRKTIRSRNKAWLEYWYCDPLIALQDLLKNPKLAAKMVFHADPQYVGNVRVYSTPETGLWWERLQTLVREEDPDGVVAALILASDETHMDHRGKAKGHPVYLTLGNIDKDDRWQPFGHVLLALLPEFPAEYNVVDKMQVHNYIMRDVLQSLKTASYTGIAMKNAAGESINVWPYLYAYVSDYPESCKITCMKSLGTLFPCSICKVDKKHLAVLQDRIQARTPFEQDTIVRDILEGRLALDAEATFSTHPVQV